MMIWGKLKPAPFLASLLSVMVASVSFAETAVDTAREALKQQEGDATTEQNLKEVFQAAEKTYSLLKKGGMSVNYGADYSYFRDSRIDIALSEGSSSITRFRIEEDAQHSIGSSLTFDYGLFDNVTLNVNFPMVIKADTLSDNKAVGLGDISFGARWQPFELKRGVPSTTLFSSLSTATGESPYKINRNSDLSTGKGYYSLSAGASMSKVMDPVVVFASGSYSIGSTASDLNQSMSGGVLKQVTPGDSMGLSMGLAYSLNYDISFSSSLQVSYGLPTELTYLRNVEEAGVTTVRKVTVESADQVTSTVNLGLSLRTSPQRIVNINFGFGLTEDSPDLMLGFSIPIDIVGLTTGE